MPIVLFIRHGENDYIEKGLLAGRLPNIHLNLTGKKQAQKLSEMLKDTPIQAIYSSPLERTMETAQLIAQGLKLEVFPRFNLIEIDYGEWQGKELKILKERKLWKIIQNAPSRVRFPGGESFAEVQTRICREVDTICSLHTDKELIICVTHCDLIKLAVAFYLGVPIDFFQRLVISTGSVTSVCLNQLNSQLLYLNTTTLDIFRKP